MQYNKKSVEDIDVSGKKVIARCDFNVPQDENGNITDDKRIRASLETINYLLDHNAAVIPVLAPRPSEGRSKHEVFAGSGR
ncbi:MAG: phosphoglycerate kinase [Butyricicoccaceae bacterium]